MSADLAALELHFLELPRFANLPLPSGVTVPSDGDPTDGLVYWCKFLSAESEQDIEALAMANPDMSEAKQALDRLSEDPKTRKLAEDRIVWEWASAPTWPTNARRGDRRGDKTACATPSEPACEVLDIELDERRDADTEDSDLTALESLLDALKRDHAWPNAPDE